jgi:single-stranded-DNA-specific exonuclease
LPAIAFRAADNEIGNAIMQAKGEVSDVVGYVKCDTWNGRKRLQFIINDLMRKA